jgi:hypothetical protein
VGVLDGNKGYTYIYMYILCRLYIYIYILCRLWEYRMEIDLGETPGELMAKLKHLEIQHL